MATGLWLTALTPEQEARLPAIRDEWLRIGLATGPGDRQAAQIAMAGAYREGGLPGPERYLWLSSPLHGAFLSAVLARGPVQPSAPGQVGGQVRDQVGGQVRGQVGGQVGGQVWDQVGGQVGDQVGGQVGGQVWDQVRDQVGDQVGDQVWDQVGDQVGGQVGGQVGRAGYGQHDANWLGFCAAFREFGVAACLRTLPMERVAREAGWWWPFRDLCILTDRPTALHRDDRHRLHCATGPALDYAGTWGVWAWHGVRVGRSVIEQEQTAALVLAERNAEVRRVRLERLGVEAFVRQAKATELHRDTDGAGQPRRLLRINLPDDEPLVAVHVRCPSTGHDHILRVPPEIATCGQAVAWTFGIDTPAYAPLVEA